MTLRRFFLVLMLSSFLLSGIAIAAPDEPANTVTISELGKQSAGIEVQGVSLTSLPNEINVAGKIDAIPTMQFDQHAPLSGRIQRVDISLGDVVQKGQPLAVVESSEMNQLAAQFLQSRLETETELANQSAVLDGNVQQAQQTAHLCEENLKRVKRLYEDKIAAQKDVLQAQTDFDLARLKLKTAKNSRDVMLKTLKARIGLIQNPIRQRLGIIGVNDKRIDDMLQDQKTLTTVPVLAARSGIITGITASAGMSIEPAINLFTISDLSKVWATANVYESDISRMRIGEKVKVKVQALNGETVHGVLTFIGSQIDDATRTLPVRAELDNRDGRLKPDMYAELLIQTTESEPVIAVPKNALVDGPAGPAVFIQEGKGYREVPVKTGRQFGSMVVLEEGLKEGNKVVVRGGFQLHAQLLKSQGREDLFISPTEGERMEDHAVDNKIGAMHMNMQTIFIVVAAAFLLGFAISALLMFKRDARHECAADFDEQHDAPVLPSALPAVALDEPHSPGPVVQASTTAKKKRSSPDA